MAIAAEPRELGIDYLLGVDGGGTATRAVLARTGGVVIGRGQAGPSALGQGIAQASRHVELAVRRAFEAAGLPLASWARCAVGAGLSGVSYHPWRDAFERANIGFARLKADTDSHACRLRCAAGWWPPRKGLRRAP